MEYTRSVSGIGVEAANQRGDHAASLPDRGYFDAVLERQIDTPIPDSGNLKADINLPQTYQLAQSSETTESNNNLTLELENILTKDIGQITDTGWALAIENMGMLSVRPNKEIKLQTTQGHIFLFGTVPGTFHVESIAVNGPIKIDSSTIKAINRWFNSIRTALEMRQVTGYTADIIRSIPVTDNAPGTIEAELMDFADAIENFPWEPRKVEMPRVNIDTGAIHFDSHASSTDKKSLTFASQSDNQMTVSISGLGNVTIGLDADGQPATLIYRDASGEVQLIEKPVFLAEVMKAIQRPLSILQGLPKLQSTEIFDKYFNGKKFSRAELMQHAVGDFVDNSDKVKISDTKGKFFSVSATVETNGGESRLTVAFDNDFQPTRAAYEGSFDATSNKQALYFATADKHEVKVLSDILNNVLLQNKGLSFQEFAKSLVRPNIAWQQGKAGAQVPVKASSQLLDKLQQDSRVIDAGHTTSGAPWINLMKDRAGEFFESGNVVYSEPGQAVFGGHGAESVVGFSPLGDGGFGIISIESAAEMLRPFVKEGSVTTVLLYCCYGGKNGNAEKLAKLLGVPVTAYSGSPSYTKFEHSDPQDLNTIIVRSNKLLPNQWWFEYLPDGRRWEIGRPVPEYSFTDILSLGNNSVDALLRNIDFSDLPAVSDYNVSLVVAKRESESEGTWEYLGPHKRRPDMKLAVASKKALEVYGNRVSRLQQAGYLPADFGMQILGKKELGQYKGVETYAVAVNRIQGQSLAQRVESSEPFNSQDVDKMRQAFTELNSRLAKNGLWLDVSSFEPSNIIIHRNSLGEIERFGFIDYKFINLPDFDSEKIAVLERELKFEDSVLELIKPDYKIASFDIRYLILNVANRLKVISGQNRQVPINTVLLINSIGEKLEKMPEVWRVPYQSLLMKLIGASNFKDSDLNYWSSAAKRGLGYESQPENETQLVDLERTIQHLKDMGVSEANIEKIKNLKTGIQNTLAPEDKLHPEDSGMPGSSQDNGDVGPITDSLRQTPSDQGNSIVDQQKPGGAEGGQLFDTTDRSTSGDYNRNPSGIKPQEKGPGLINQTVSMSPQDAKPFDTISPETGALRQINEKPAMPTIKPSTVVVGNQPVEEAEPLSDDSSLRRVFDTLHPDVRSDMTFEVFAKLDPNTITLLVSRSKQAAVQDATINMHNQKAAIARRLSSDLGAVTQAQQQLTQQTLQQVEAKKAQPTQSVETISLQSRFPAAEMVRDGSSAVGQVREVQNNIVSTNLSGIGSSQQAGNAVNVNVAEIPMISLIGKQGEVANSYTQADSIPKYMLRNTESGVQLHAVIEKPNNELAFVKVTGINIPANAKLTHYSHSAKAWVNLPQLSASELNFINSQIQTAQQTPIIPTAPVNGVNGAPNAPVSVPAVPVP